MYIDKYRAYILGFIWADGYINYNNIVIEAVAEDLDTLLPIFKLTNWEWKEYRRKREGKKATLILSTLDLELRHFLLENNYKNKSRCSHKNIIESIPVCHRMHWLRGFTDGDGSWLCCTKTSKYEVCWTSSYLQDWEYFQSFIKELRVKTKLYKQKNNYSGSTKLVVHSRYHTEYLGSLIYFDFEQEPIGLQRKYEKYKKICKAIPDHKSARVKTSSYKGVSKHGGKWQALIKVNKESYYLGSYSSEIEAALAYNNFINNNNLIRKLNEIQRSI